MTTSPADIRVGPVGLTDAQARARLAEDGPNLLRRVQRRSRPWELGRQLVHPLALLLWFATALSLGTGEAQLAAVIVVVLLLNAFFAFAQELQAERAVEALGSYLPWQAIVVRDGKERLVPAADVVVGDLVRVEAGDRVPADGELVDGAMQVDMSALTGESVPVGRIGRASREGEGGDRMLSGTLCVGGGGSYVVDATGMDTEIGRIAALTSRVRERPSPLELQVRRTAVVISIVAIVVGVVFMLVGTLVAGLSLPDAITFAIGLLVANVPEGLLPTITLALAVGVRLLARERALVKRLSAVETLGSTTVICTDKTGTLTRNRLRVEALWAPGIDESGLRHTLAEAGHGGTDRPAPADHPDPGSASPGAARDAAHSASTTMSRHTNIRRLLRVVSMCNNASASGAGHDDPTERALIELAVHAGEHVSDSWRDHVRAAEFAFDPTRKLMSTVDRLEDGLHVHLKGAPEEVLERCSHIVTPDGGAVPIDRATSRLVRVIVDRWAADGLRVLAAAERALDHGSHPPGERDDVERGLVLVGLVGLADGIRPEVPAAVAACHDAGIRIVVITGDHGLTARAIARTAGIVGEREPRIVTGGEVDALTDEALASLFAGDEDVIFARSSPEAKLRIARALQSTGHVVAMTGDGVNDAPALRQADIGVAMGRDGTDVAREAAAMILTDDNFATIVTAVAEGRVVYANIRKFIVYVFAHATPEVVPFLVFALSGGAVPLPLTAAQILAIDLGTETLPALALGREPPEPGLMDRPPRPRSEPIVTGGMMVRSWLFLGMVSAGLVMVAFFSELLRAGWHPGAAVGAGSDLYEAYLRATTMTFLGIVACQVGTAFAARTERESLRAVGAFSNRLLFAGIAFELVVAWAIVWLAPLQGVFGTAPVDAASLALIAPFPVVVWGADELRRAWVRRAGAARPLRR